MIVPEEQGASLLQIRQMIVSRLSTNAGTRTPMYTGLPQVSKLLKRLQLMIQQATGPEESEVCL